MTFLNSGGGGWEIPPVFPGFLKPVERFVASPPLSPGI